jgi:acyl-CoA synthetase (AMP-forming)/AMP-acid ligase II
MRAIDYFDRGAALHPAAAAFVSGDQVMSYRDAQARTIAIAAALRDFGVEPGVTTIGVLSPNDVTAFLCVLATLRIGGVWAPINARNGIDENIAVMDRAECTILVMHSSFAEYLPRLKAELPRLKQIVTLDKRVEGVRFLDDLVNGAAGKSLPVLPHDPHRVSAILSTSGTTGQPKGVVWEDLTWETMVANFWIHMPCEKRPVYLLAAPMTHAAGVLAFPIMAAGGTVIVLDGVNPQEIIAAIETHRVTHFFLPPTAIYKLLDHPGIEKHDFSSLMYFIYTAAPMAVEKLKQAIAVFGPVMTQVYGQAEVPAMGTFLSPREHVVALESGKEERLWSCGKPGLLTTLDIQDDSGQSVSSRVHGEIVFAGNLVSPVYYKNPEATAEVKRDGWHHTGDVGFRDEDGYIYIVDRKKDMIITGGFNVYSTEVEKIVLSHPAVRDCAVIGVPDDKWGEAVKAIIELNDGMSVEPAEIIALCRSRLGGVKTPKSVEIWPSLPRSANGKVLKRTIRDQFWANQRRAV